MPLRTGQPSDIDALTDLYALSFDMPWKKEDFAGFIVKPEYGLLVEKDASGLHGFVLYRSMHEEAEIVTCVVQPVKRGTGLGGRLLRAALHQLREGAVKDVFLEVAVDNETARRLYSHCGFVSVSIRKAYYARKGADAVDAEVMRLAL